jgi:hypothetical protein
MLGKGIHVRNNLKDKDDNNQERPLLLGMLEGRFLPVGKFFGF